MCRAFNGFAQSRQHHALVAQVDAHAVHKENDFQGRNGHAVASGDCALQGGTASGSCVPMDLLMAAKFCKTIRLGCHCKRNSGKICNLSYQNAVGLVC